MRAKAGFLILLGLILLIGVATAEWADYASSISSDKEWIVANNVDTSVITVVAKNSSQYLPPSNRLVPGATVTFTVDDSSYGSFSSSTVTTDASGVAITSFKAKTKSGTAVITATITSDDSGTPHSQVLTINQKIDHDLAQYAVFDNKPELPVGTVTTFNIAITDIWGNPVDNRTAENHTFTLYMPGGQGRGLWDGSSYVETITLATNSSGKSAITCRVAEVAGSNFVTMVPIGNMAVSPKAWIVGYALDEPYFMTQIHPNPDEIRADGIEMFGLSYLLFDKYNNPVNDTAIHISASDGTSYDGNTTSEGALYATFGPKDTAGTYTLIATAASNASVNCSTSGSATYTTGFCTQNLTFHNTEPVDLRVSGIPLNLASYDVNPSSQGIVSARVVDIKGNSVIGETVTFTLGTPTYPDGPYNTTSGPSISPTSAVTGAGGVANCIFTPGAFVNYTNPDAFNATATGQVTVTATWTNKNGTLTKSQDVTFIWKNYPYLSISVPDDVCSDVKVGDKINISVNLFGDGAALRPKPIDVVLVTDVSGSMNSPATKITNARLAAKTFAAAMSDQDRVGLESYGWKTPTSPTPVWSAYARDDLPLTPIDPTTIGTVNSMIDTYTPQGNTPMRPAIYNATNLIKYNMRPGAVRAILLMTDGEWNIAGDPTGASANNPCTGSTTYPRMAFPSPDALAGTDSVITYANQSGIRIYTVGLVVSDCTNNSLHSYAVATGGKNYRVNDPSQLSDIYKQIAGDLQETAGGNTQVYLDFGNLTVNSFNNASIHNYMDYEPVIHLPAQEGDSTFIRKTNITKSGATNLIYKYDQDDSSNWTANSMTFNVGEIRLNESWYTSFRVNLTQSGQIRLFGPDNPSKICFTDASTGATNCQSIKEWFCPVQQTKVNEGFAHADIVISNLSATNTTDNPDILTIRWDTTYNGNFSVTEKVEYQDPISKNWKQIGGPLFVGSKSYAVPRVVTTDTGGWVPGTYNIRIRATAMDGSATGSTVWTKSAPYSQKFIKLE